MFQFVRAKDFVIVGAPIILFGAAAIILAIMTARAEFDSAASSERTTTVQYDVDSDDFTNPERGFFAWMDFNQIAGTLRPIPASPDPSAGEARDRRIRELVNDWERRRQEFSLVYLGVRLPFDGHVSQGIHDTTPSIDRDLNRVLGFVRNRGFKVILRFYYSDPNQLNDPNRLEDADLLTIERHVRNLAPVLRANLDIIAVMQAGLIGRWGEWHNSTHRLDNSDDRESVLDLLLGALQPPTRMVQVRRPFFKQEIYGGPLPNASVGSERIGHHNDCFLGTPDDLGTFVPNPPSINEWKNFVAQEGLVTPIGGETCCVYPNPDSGLPCDFVDPRARFRCVDAKMEMEQLHYSFLNSDDWRGVVDHWRQSPTCYDEIARNLGYRFVLEEAKFTQTVRPGGLISIEVRLRNDGYASLFNYRPLYVVLMRPLQSLGPGIYMVIYEAKLRTRPEPGTATVWESSGLSYRGDIDPQSWASGETHTLRTFLRVPSDAVEGTYYIGLWLPDESRTFHTSGRSEFSRTPLRSDGDYAIRFANRGVWSAVSATNRLGQIVIDDAAGGSSHDASVFREVYRRTIWRAQLH